MSPYCCVCMFVLLLHISLQASIEESKTQYLEVLKENTRRLNRISELQSSKKELEKRLNARQKTMVGLVVVHLVEYTCTAPLKGTPLYVACIHACMHTHTLTCCLF